MRPRYCVLQALHGHVRVYLGGGKRRVAQHLLHRAQVGASIKKVRREAVPELVRRKVGRKPRLGKVELHAPLHKPWRDATARRRQEHVGVVFRKPAVDLAGLAAQAEKSIERRPAEDDEALLRALSQDDQGAAAEVDLAPLDAHHLAYAAACRVQRLEEGGVAARRIRVECSRLHVLHRPREETCDVFDRQRLRQALRLARPPQEPERIVDENAFALQKAAESARGGELAADRRRLRPGLREGHEVSARVRLGERRPVVRRLGALAELCGDKLRQVLHVADARVLGHVPLRQEIPRESVDARVGGRMPIQARRHFPWRTQARPSSCRSRLSCRGTRPERASARRPA